MCEAHGYGGDLCVAGPEPYYGRSSEVERELIRTLPSPIRDRIQHLGRVDEATRWSLLTQADLVLYPSVVEGFGMVPFEAASVGTPSLVAPGSALEEVFGESGAVVPSWDVSKWARCAVDLTNSPERRSEVINGIRTVGERHSWAAVARSTWNAIDETLARPKARLHEEEGGLLSRVGIYPGLVSTASMTHLLSRSMAYGYRRLSSRLR
jgi:glycosyltransferase involved in cell wall biosynthesis